MKSAAAIKPTPDKVLDVTFNPTFDVVNEKLQQLIANMPEEITKEEKEKISKEMQDLLDQGADIHTCNGSTTAFMFAAKYCNQKVIKTFMDRTASLESEREKLFSEVNKKGMNAAFFAIQNDDAEVMEYLLDKIEKVDEVRDRNGCTLLMYAAAAKNIAAITYLIYQRGAGVDVTDSSGRTALIHAIKSNELESVEILIQKGANVNAEWNYNIQRGFTALMYAAKNPNDTKIAEKLLEHGADVRAMNSCRGMPLRYAIWSKNIPLVKLFLENGAFENASAEEKVDVLRLAVTEKIPEVAALLVDAGANPNLHNYANHNAVDHAVHGEQKEILKIFFTQGPEEQRKQAIKEAIFPSVKNLNFKATKFLLEQGINVNIEDKEGKTLLRHLAETKVYNCFGEDELWNKIFKIADLLLEYGANVDSALYDFATHTPTESSKKREFLFKLLARNEGIADGNGIFPKIPEENSASSSSTDNPLPLSSSENSQSSSSSADNPPPPPSIAKPQPTEQLISKLGRSL